ncbi:DUF1534 domain-containing protein [Pseudomonas syringae pv. maculicola str. ES4326]|uniref:DUF1534 domain-containing protein n=1 Tax=Pseudomonas syringae pv. maculicola str. ES4326 TaxID=629265 RepID=A0A8T8C6X1_PSEYM|nr:DUF1534 domain-containing protein [Pseudomonas syringae pv. maculicola str. ES4326]
MPGSSRASAASPGPLPQRGNALGDALRHKSVPRCMLESGRGASRAACPRGAWAR